jgi:hypothetical protein
VSGVEGPDPSRLRPARGTWRRALSGAAFGLLLAGGCYAWQPVSLARPEPGARLDVLLSAEGTTMLADSLGGGVVEVEGEALGSDARLLRLAVRQVTDARGVSHDWRGETVLIPTSYVTGVSRRRFAPGGTLLAGGVAAGGLYAIYRLLGGPGILSGGGSGSGSGGR